MKTKQTIALTGWSTGGHIFPLISVYNYIKEDYPETNFVWIWEEDSLEQDISKKSKIPFHPIVAGKIRRYFDIRNFYEPLKNLTGICYWIHYIWKHNIDIIFSKWWYVSLPLCIAGYIMRKKIYIHESDSVTGLANTLIWKIATKVFYSFPNKHTGEMNNKHIEAWQILNPELLDTLTDTQVNENARLQVIVTGGTQWSTHIFNTLLTILPDLQDIDFQIVLGEKNMHFREDFKKFPNTLVHDFLTQKRLWKILKNTDISVSRGGATSLAEYNAFWIHSIIIPLSNSAAGHQQKNAQYYHQEFWSNVLDENENLDLELFRLLQKYKNLRKSGLNLDQFFRALNIINKGLLD